MFSSSLALLLDLSTLFSSAIVSSSLVSSVVIPSIFSNNRLHFKDEKLDFYLMDLIYISLFLVYLEDLLCIVKHSYNVCHPVLLHLGQVLGVLVVPHIEARQNLHHN